MSDFKHSIVLFTGDDGLPLAFNVRNTNEKAHLKALIEHGGGLCTQNENSVHLISPGTKVLNVDLGKKLVSSSYIHDCVKQNYLLDVNEYVFTISEAQTSDISDEDSERLLAQRQSTCKTAENNIPPMHIDISPVKIPNVSNETTPSNLTLPSSNNAVPPICTSSESFIEGSQEVSSKYKITSHVYCGIASNPASEGLQENSEDFNPSQSIVFPSNPTNVVNNNVRNLRSPLKQAEVLKDQIGSPLNTCSPLKQLVTLENPIGNPLTFHSPSKQMNTLSNDTGKSLNLHSSASKILQQKVPSSPKRQVNISPIMRADTKKVKTQHLEFPVRSPFQVLPESLQIDKGLQINPEKEDCFNMDVDDNFQPGNQILSSELPVKNTEANKFNHNTSVVDTVVSSSQPVDELDNFDNMLLSKAFRKPQSQEEESSSQACTVSSSADVASKHSSVEDTTPPMPAGNSDSIPDSPNFNQINEELYMKNLEEEVQEILKKTQPKTIQDKITLVKYVCCVRKLTPRIVLDSLLSKSNSLEI